MKSFYSFIGNVLVLVFIFSCSKEIVTAPDLAKILTGEYIQSDTVFIDTIVVEKIDNNTVRIKGLSLLSDFNAELIETGDKIIVEVPEQVIFYSDYHASIVSDSSASHESYYSKSDEVLFINTVVTWTLDIEHVTCFNFQGKKTE